MADFTNAIEKLYVAYFNRPADPAGLAYWNAVLNNAPDGFQILSQQFSSSAEYLGTYGNLAHRDMVDAVYAHLFGRPAEAAGLDYWTALLDQGQVTIDNVVTEVSAGAQGNDSFVTNARAAVATEFTAHVDTPVEQQAYSGAHANSVAAAYVASVHDLASASAAMDPGAIDDLIAHIVTDAGLSGVGAAELVGVPPAPG